MPAFPWSQIPVAWQGTRSPGGRRAGLCLQVALTLGSGAQDALKAPVAFPGDQSTCAHTFSKPLALCASTCCVTYSGDHLLRWPIGWNRTVPSHLSNPCLWDLTPPVSHPYWDPPPLPHHVPVPLGRVGRRSPCSSQLPSSIHPVLGGGEGSVPLLASLPLTHFSKLMLWLFLPLKPAPDPISAGRPAPSLSCPSRAICPCCDPFLCSHSL